MCSSGTMEVILSETLQFNKPTIGRFRPQTTGNVSYNTCGVMGGGNEQKYKRLHNEISFNKWRLWRLSASLTAKLIKICLNLVLGTFLFLQRDGWSLLWIAWFEKKKKESVELISMFDWRDADDIGLGIFQNKSRHQPLGIEQMWKPWLTGVSSIVMRRMSQKHKNPACDSAARTQTVELYRSSYLVTLHKWVFALLIGQHRVIARRHHSTWSKGWRTAPLCSVMCCGMSTGCRVGEDNVQTTGRKCDGWGAAYHERSR